MVRAVSAPITPIDERLWPERHLRVFYLFKAFSVIRAVESCWWLFHSVPFDLVDMLLAEG